MTRNRGVPSLPLLVLHARTTGSPPRPWSSLLPTAVLPRPPAAANGGQAWGGRGGGCRTAASARRLGCQPPEHFPAREQIRGKRWMGTLVTADGGFDLQKQARRGLANRDGEAAPARPVSAAPRARQCPGDAVAPAARAGRPAVHWKDLLTFPTHFVRQSVGLRQRWLPSAFY